MPEATRRKTSPSQARSNYKATSSDMARFWAKVDKTETCWLWTGALSAGYGRIAAGGLVYGAHRFAYRELRGPIPDGMVIDHLCRNRACVNPEHLSPVTLGQNSTHNSVSPAAQNTVKTHCKRGHPFDEANTIWNDLGHRNCRACRKRSGRAKPGQARRRVLLGLLAAAEAALAEVESLPVSATASQLRSAINSVHDHLRESAQLVPGDDR